MAKDIAEVRRMLRVIVIVEFALKVPWIELDRWRYKPVRDRMGEGVKIWEV